MSSTTHHQPAPAAHVAVALHAVTTHMVMNELPPPLDLWTDDLTVMVALSEPAYDHWVTSLGAERPAEVEGPVVDGKQSFTLDARLPDTGVRVQLRTTSRAPAAGRHRLAVVPA